MRLAISGLIGFCITSIEATSATRISAKSISDYEKDALCKENIYVARLDAHPRPHISSSDPSSSYLSVIPLPSSSCSNSATNNSRFASVK